MSSKTEISIHLKWRASRKNRLLAIFVDGCQRWWNKSMWENTFPVELISPCKPIAFLIEICEIEIPPVQPSSFDSQRSSMTRFQWENFSLEKFCLGYMTLPSGRQKMEDLVSQHERLTFENLYHKQLWSRRSQRNWHNNASGIWKVH